MVLRLSSDGEVDPLAFFEDDTPYTYDYVELEKAGIVNAGWLERGKPYRTGVIERDALQKLAALCLDADHGHRGYHICSLCPDSLSGAPWYLAIDHEAQSPVRSRRRFMPWLAKSNRASELRSHLLGSKVVHIPGNQGEYRAPDLVLHYVLDHYYLPPKPFLDSLRRLGKTLEDQSWCLVHGADLGGVRRAASSYPNLDDLLEEAVRPFLIRGQECEAIEVYRKMRQVELPAARVAVQESAVALREHRRQEVAEIIRSHDGLSTKECVCQGCGQPALGDLVICVDHAYPEG